MQLKEMKLPIFTVMDLEPPVLSPKKDDIISIRTADDIACLTEDMKTGRYFGCTRIDLHSTN